MAHSKTSPVSRPAARKDVAPARPVDPVLRAVLLIVGLVTVLRLFWLSRQVIDLYPDEAQYWIWAQTPDWGYFSKPPMVAWLIALTTRLFGESDLAVKAAAPLLYIATTRVVFAIGERLYGRLTGAWAAVAFITLPAVSLSALIISTDVPLLLFWALATYGLIRAREAQDKNAALPWWLLVGISGGLGLLSKYAMGFWLASAFAFLVLLKDERKHLKGFGLAFLVSLAVFAPNIVWNAAHRFATYAHTDANANLHGFALHLTPFLEFAGSQVGVFGPIFLGTLLFILVFGRGFLRERPGLLLAFLALPTLAIMLCEAALSRAQPNWSAPTYVTATVLVVAYLCRHGRKALVLASILLHVAFAALIMESRDIEQALHRQLPLRFEPLHRLRGWRTLGTAVAHLQIEHPQLRPLADERELMASLIYYMQPHPLDMLVWNPAQHVQNGFEMNQSLPNVPGGDYLWMTETNSPSGIAAVVMHFRHWGLIGHVTVPVAKGLQRSVYLYGLYGFLGYDAATPPNPPLAPVPPATSSVSPGASPSAQPATPSAVGPAAPPPAAPVHS